MKLNISSKFSLPVEAVTQTFGILAKRGVGKTYLAAVMAEEMLAASQTICIVDPIVGMNPATKARLADLQARAACKPCGTRAKYIAAKCRCMLCRAANSRYAAARESARRTGDHRELVDSKLAVSHLKNLSRQGVGYKSVAAAAGLTTTTVFQILSGSRCRIRADTEQRIVSVDRDAIADKALVSAASTWKRLNILVQRGYTKAQLAHWLGAKMPALQVGKENITARMAMRVEKLYLAIEAGKMKRA